jgi:hypothetical protein
MEVTLEMILDGKGRDLFETCSGICLTNLLIARLGETRNPY